MTGNHTVRTVNLKIKAAGEKDGLEDGQFTGYASVFGNVDSYGDVVVKGAFAETLAEWEKTDATIPLLWGHDMRDPYSYIGHVVSAEEDDIGLKVTCQIDVEDDTNSKARQVYKLVKGRRISRMSFAYDVVDAHEETVDEKSVLMLTKLKLWEVSVVPVPANPEAVIETVKRSPSIDPAALKQIADSVAGAVRAAILGDAQAREPQPTPDETTPSGKSRESAASSPPDYYYSLITAGVPVERTK